MTNEHTLTRERERSGPEHTHVHGRCTNTYAGARAGERELKIVCVLHNLVHPLWCQVTHSVAFDSSSSWLTHRAMCQMQGYQGVLKGTSYGHFTENKFAKNL